MMASKLAPTSPCAKRRKNDNLQSSLVNNFLSWCKDVGLLLNDKVTVREDGSCHRFGMIALDNIEKGEWLFNIPRTILLEPSTSVISDILVGLNQKDENSRAQKWLPLMLSLLYEYTNPTSKWHPYLDMVPSQTVLNQPIFWNEQELELLNFVEMKTSVENDLKQIKDQYNNHVLPFMKAHSKFFDPKVHTLELYKHLSGFVMAYSFTDNDGTDEEVTAAPAMVPMADILNHVSEHNAHLQFGEHHLSMVAIKPIEKGEEVFNTYGSLVNRTLLQCYGFMEECPNRYDMVEIPMEMFKEVLGITDDKWQNKMAHLSKILPNRCDEGIFFDIQGCLGSEDEFFEIFQTLHQTESVDSREGENSSDPRERSDDGENIEDRESTDGEDEDEEEQECESGGSELEVEDFQPYDELTCLDDTWKQTLYRAAKICSEKIQRRLSELQNFPTRDVDPGRKTMVVNLLKGQLQLLKLVQELEDHETG